MSLMLEEICEQPAVLEKTITAETPKINKLGEFLRSKDIDLIMLAARGLMEKIAEMSSDPK